MHSNEESDTKQTHADTEKSLPEFDFWSGFVGYFGYEMKCESLNLPQDSRNVRPHANTGPKDPENRGECCTFDIF